MRTLLVSLFLMVCLSAGAATTRYTSGDSGSVAQAIGNSADGDTVFLTNGATWSSTVTCSKGITICSTNISLTNSFGDGMLNCNAGDKRLTVNGIRFIGSAAATFGILKIGGHNWRVCTNYFYSADDSGIWVDGDAWGLIDHCTIQGNMSTGDASGQSGIRFTGDESTWARTFRWGTTNCTVIEDCVFNFTGSSEVNGGTDGWGGCNFVVRHCMMTNAPIANHGADQSAPDYRRSALAYEAYNNVIALTGDGAKWSLEMRGGTMLAYSNQIVNTSPSGISGSGERGYWFALVYHRAQTSACYNKNIAYGYMQVITHSPNPFDGNKDSTGWPGFDQPGRVGPSTNFIPGNPPTVNGSHVDQVSSPVYCWSNTYYSQSRGLVSPDATGDDGCESATATQVVKANRDYFNNTKAPGYVALGYPHPMLTNSGSGPNTYYIAPASASPAGSDSNSGTITSPWRTIGHATPLMTSGDTLYVRGGTYTEIFNITGPNGSSTTTIKAYPGEVPVFNSASHSDNKIHSVTNLVMDGLQITGCEVGVFVEASCSGVTLRNMVIHDLDQEAIHIKQYASNILVDSCTISNTGLLGAYGEGIYLGTGDSSLTGLDNTHDLIIRSNLVHDTLGEGIEIKGGTYNITLDHNTIYTANKTQVPSGQGGGAIEVNQNGTYNFYNPNPNHVIKNNIIYDTVIGIRAGNGGTYFNNVVYSCSQYGILINNNDSDTWNRNVYHNTVDTGSGSSIVVNGTVNTVILNNIGRVATYNLAANSTYFSDYNGHNYHLIFGSAPINAGTNLTAIVPVDIDGVTRVSPDIGAYEYVGGTPVAQVTPSSLVWTMNPGGGSSNKVFTVKNIGTGTLTGYVHFATP